MFSGKPGQMTDTAKGIDEVVKTGVGVVWMILFAVAAQKYQLVAWFSVSDFT